MGRRGARPAHRGRLRCGAGAGRRRAQAGPAPVLAACCAARRRPRAAAGRWSLVPTTGSDIDRDELAEAVAELLLRRWGVIFRDLAVHDSLRFPWRELQWALRRLEDRGLVRGGRFVTGFTGEQYALPEAVEQLAHVAKLPRTGERVTVNATDPLNLIGVIVPGTNVPTVRTRHVVYVDGCPEGTEVADVAECRRGAEPGRCPRPWVEIDGYPRSARVRREAKERSDDRYREPRPGRADRRGALGPRAVGRSGHTGGRGRGPVLGGHRHDAPTVRCRSGTCPRRRAGGC